jgi:hypothetical protein
MQQANISGAEPQIETEMARKASSKGGSIDQAAVDRLVAMLKLAGTDSEAFLAAIDVVKAETTAQELIAIAWAYGGGGIKPTRKDAAVEKIEKRFNELKHKKANGLIAAKARPW